MSFSCERTPCVIADHLDIRQVVPRLMTQSDLADYLGKSNGWCERARWAGEGPKFVKLGRHVRYRASDVEDWIASSVRQSTSEI